MTVTRAETDKLLFEPPPVSTVPVQGEDRLFAVRRIFCVGRNYAAHAREMGTDVDHEAPFYFLKDASAIVPTGATVPYALGTRNYHHEMEFVVAIGRATFRADAASAEAAVFGYAAGLDMTRRDLQQDARGKGRPWDFGKNFERSAVIAPITRAAQFGAVGPQRITLRVGDTLRQDARLSDLVWSVGDIVMHLSRYYHLAPGDLIYTGTPAGVGAVQPGDLIRGEVEGLAPVELTVGAAE